MAPAGNIPAFIFAISMYQVVNITSPVLISKQLHSLFLIFLKNKARYLIITYLCNDF